MAGEPCHLAYPAPGREDAVPTRPDMILQFAHHLDRDLSAIPRSLAPADWIGPLDHALKPGHFLP